MRLETGYEGRGVRIEMTPLMDVVFLLLVFFIYAMFTMTVQEGVRVDLPRANGQGSAREAVVITMTRDGTYQVDGRDLTRDDVLLIAVDRHRAEGLPVVINADRRVPFGTGVELLARLKSAGIDAVTFQVAPDGEAP